MSDTHIAADPKELQRGQVMAENLRAVVLDILAQPERPVGIFVDGDLALKDGKPGDYKTFLDLTEPIRKAGIPLHLTLGNHDDRAHFRAALRDAAPVESEVVDKQASVVAGANLRFLVLDSLDRVNETPGLLGDRQLQWLARRLDAAPEIPSVLLVHHNLSQLPGALTDTVAFLNVIRPRRQVKAVFYGHSHRWENAEDAGIHLVNLPAVAYPFAANQPLGWCRFRPSADGAEVELRCVGGDRSKDRQTVALRWRST